MYSLYIDTHSTFVTIVLYKDGLLVKEKTKESLQSHSICTIPSIEDILKEENIQVADLKEIFVVNGPGSFTGVRIGVTIAKTLGFTLDIPVKTVSSLKIKAISSKLNENKIVIISDRNGKYIGEFDALNNEISNYKYLKNNEYEEYIKSKKIKIIENQTIDFNSLYDYLKNIETVNVHQVNPVYVKNIEV